MADPHEFVPIPSPETIDLLALSLVPGLGPRLTRALLQRFGSAGAVRQLSVQQLQEIPQIGEKLSRQFVDALRSIPLQQEIDLLRQHRVRVIARGEFDYPAMLADLPDAPPLLYVRGSLLPTDRRAIAVVGSRQCSAYGRRIAQQIATGLARRGFTIVSGLALGIDGAVHEAALQAGGRTLAVLAGGLSSIYPPQHLDLSRRIEEAGCLLSETPMSLPPQAGMFPARNRIISGLSQAVVVIEAGERSGALITASHALNQGREVFAVPGPVDSPYSAGSLQLLRDGARLARNADDILEDLRGIATESSIDHSTDSAISSSRPISSESSVEPDLSGDERRIWDTLAGGAQPFDVLVRTTGLPVAHLQGVLMSLEIKRAIRRLPGNLVERRV
jgi:DNA processing protein